MRANLLPLTLGAALAALTPTLRAHGGTYRGPGDVVVPGGNGGKGPRTSGPVTPGPNGPNVPGPITPPGGSKTPGPLTPGIGNPRVGGGNPLTGGGSGPDLTRWQFWWEFNKDPYLNLKAAIHAEAPVSGSDTFYLGGDVPARDRIFVSEHVVREDVLPALARALESTTNRDINSSCMIALAKIGKNDEVKGIELARLFKKRLTSGDQEIRETAALALGLSLRDEAIEPLLALVEDSAAGRSLVERSEVDDMTRSYAIYGLGLLAHGTKRVESKARALAAFQKILSDSRASNRNLKVAAVLGHQLVAPGPAPRDTAHQALHDGAVQSLLAFWKLDLGRSEQVVQAHAPTALGHLLGRGDSPVHAEVKKLCAAVLDVASPRKVAVELIQSAAIALGLITKPDDVASIETLAAYVKNGKDQMARNFALIALGEIGGERARAELLDVLARGHKLLTKPWAAIALGVLASRAASAVGENAPVDVELGRALRSALKEATAPEAKSALAIALGLARYTDAVDDLRELLHSAEHDDELCGYTAIALALMDDQRSVAALHSIVKRAMRRPDLLKQAAVALGKLGDKGVTDVLLQMLKSTDSNIAKLSAVATAFSFIGDRRTISPLVGILFDTTMPDLSRAFAAVALGGIADKELLPWNSKIATDLNYRASVETLTNQSTGVLDIL